jgi:hypothetical protein
VNARPRDGGARLRHHRPGGRRYLRLCARARDFRRAAPARPRQRAAPPPATAIVDALAVTPSDSYSLALWNAHVERTRAAAQAFKAGWPSPGATLRTARAREPRPPVKHLIHGERKQLILPA